MNIEQKLEILKLAIERGANIDVHFHEIPSSVQAEKDAAIFENITNSIAEKRSHGGSEWLKIYADNLHLAFYYNANKEERIAQLQKELEELEGFRTCQA